jgi:hypothetical protein
MVDRERFYVFHLPHSWGDFNRLIFMISIDRHPAV